MNEIMAFVFVLSVIGVLLYLWSKWTDKELNELAFMQHTMETIKKDNDLCNIRLIILDEMKKNEDE